MPLRQQKIVWLGGILYGLLLAIWSACAIGTGHGTTLPLFISSSPLSLIGFAAYNDSTSLSWVLPVMWASPFLIWTLVVFLMFRALHSRRLKLAFFSMMGTHYLGVAIILYQFRHDLGGITEPFCIMCWLLTYLFGQMAVWTSFIHIVTADRSKHNE